MVERVNGADKLVNAAIFGHMAEICDRPISVIKVSVNLNLEACRGEGEYECQREDIAPIKKAASHTDVGIARHRLHVR